MRAVPHCGHRPRITEHGLVKMTQQLSFNLMPNRKTFTVSELTGKIRDLLAKNFTDISVQGEISNCREAQSGHIYFTLKDDRAQVRCVYFKQHSVASSSALRTACKSPYAGASASTSSAVNIRSTSRKSTWWGRARCSLLLSN